MFGRLFFTHDIYPHPHPPLTTSSHYPRPTTFSNTRRRTFAAHARTQFAGLKVCRFHWRALNLPTCCVLFLVLLGNFLGCTSLVMFRLCISSISRTLGPHCSRSIRIGRELRVIIGKGLGRIRIGLGVGEWSGHRRKGFGSSSERAGKIEHNKGKMKKRI